MFQVFHRSLQIAFEWNAVFGTRFSSNKKYETHDDKNALMCLHLNKA